MITEAQLKVGGVYLLDALGTGVSRCRVVDTDSPGTSVTTILHDDGTGRMMATPKEYFMANASMVDVVGDEPGDSTLKIVIVVAMIVAYFWFTTRGST